LMGGASDFFFFSSFLGIIGCDLSTCTHKATEDTFYNTILQALEGQEK
jgi:hypothetical protein